MPMHSSACARKSPVAISIKRPKPLSTCSVTAATQPILIGHRGGGVTWCRVKSTISEVARQANRPSGYDNRRPTHNEISGAFQRMACWQTLVCGPQTLTDPCNWAIGQRNSRHAPAAFAEPTSTAKDETDPLRTKFPAIFIGSTKNQCCQRSALAASHAYASFSQSPCALCGVGCRILVSQASCLRGTPRGFVPDWLAHRQNGPPFRYNHRHLGRQEDRWNFCSCTAVVAPLDGG